MWTTSELMASEASLSATRALRISQLALWLTSPDGPDKGIVSDAIMRITAQEGEIYIYETANLLRL